MANVFVKGDSYFRSGDLLRQDEAGYFYFVDRIGDTFRWKGENVSTNEVAEVISSVPGVQEANVYGVSVPGHDGKAGMACIVVNSEFDFTTFFNQFSFFISHSFLFFLLTLFVSTKAQLPGYALPIFVRIQPEIEITSTFKHKKVELKKEGFNPSVVTDKLFFRDADQNQYVPLNTVLYKEIVSGERSRL